MTLAVALLVLLRERIPAPGIAAPALGVASSRNIFALGLWPVLAAYLVVETVAAIAPRWRSLRHTGATARAKLDFVVGILATAIAIVSAFVIVPRPSNGPLFVVTLVAGMFALWMAARSCTRLGLVNGYALVLCVTAMQSMVRVTRGAFVENDSGGMRAATISATISLLAIPSIVALVLDVASAIRLHASDHRLVCVWEERRASKVFVLRRALAAEGIPVHVRGARLFASFLCVCPFVPAELWVPLREASGAREWLADANDASAP